LYRLTPAEADIAVRLFDGFDRSAISEARSVSAETIRTQTKSIYAKIGLGGEADLVRLLATIMS
jgi:DNA-binding CsgD family transcriptional regulator